METIFTTDSFEAFRNENGITIQSKSKGAQKMGLICMVLGLVFVGISFFDFSNLFMDPDTGFARFVTNFTFYVFRYGGITLAVLGLILVAMKSKLSSRKIVFDAGKKELNIHNKTIPFSEIREITLQSQQIFGKTMSAILFDHSGKKKGLLPPSLIKHEPGKLEQFVSELNQTIKA